MAVSNVWICCVLLCSGITVAVTGTGNTQTSMVTGQEGEDVTLRCTIEQPTESTHHPSIKWERVSGQINPSTFTVARYEYSRVSHLDERYDISGDHSLIIQNVTISDEGLYRCKLVYKKINLQEVDDSPYITYIQEVRLTVISAIDELLLYPKETSRVVQLAKTFVCNATNSKPPALIKWKINGVVITQSTSEFSIYNHHENSTHGTTNSISELTFLSIPREPQIRLTCIAKQDNLEETLVSKLLTFDTESGKQEPTSANVTTTPLKVVLTNNKRIWMLAVVILSAISCVLIIFSITSIVCCLRKGRNNHGTGHRDIESKDSLRSSGTEGLSESQVPLAQNKNNNITGEEMPSFSLIAEFSTEIGVTNALVPNPLSSSPSHDSPDLAGHQRSGPSTSGNRDSSYNGDGILRQIELSQDDSSSILSTASTCSVSSEGSLSDRPLSSGYVHDKDAFEISRSDIIDMSEKLGEGYFGEVYKGLVKLPGKDETSVVAIKTLKECNRSDLYDDLLQELEIMKTLKVHPNVVTLLGCCTRPRDAPIYVIVEFVPCGTLRQYLKEHRPNAGTSSPGMVCNRILTNKDLIKFAYEVAKGMEFLHQNRCIHRDLAARNILVTHDVTCKISDFGLARNIRETHEYVKKSSGPLPLRWEAPESLLQHVYNLKTDVWSYGILLWEIVTFGSRPYPHLESCEDVRRDILQGHTMQKPKHCHKHLYKIMKACWAKDPEKRPDFSSIVAKLKPMRSTEQEYVSTSLYDVMSYNN